jgi:ATP-binding protein involved in chromosome partitioning
MMGVPHVDPKTTSFPIEKFGLKLMSMGFVVDANQAAILRGPMIHKYLTAFLTQIAWGELDFLLVDMPPGTGDAQLSMSQTAPVSGVVTVVTPQDVSLTVARRGLEMFRTVKVPILGIVENMSYFTGDDGKRYEIFRHGGGQKLAKDAGVPFLGEIPIDPRVAECGDAGEPIVHKYPDSIVAKAYLELASKVSEELKKSPPPAELPSLKL